MGKIENIKTYNGQVLDNIFFRPMLTGKSAEELGIKVMYNVPAPTTLHFWKRSGEVLQKYTSSGWSGGTPADKYQKTIDLSKVKAEMAYSAEDYFSTVYEIITSRPDVNLDDLSGSELEEAETSLFRASIAESIRATMWYGDASREGKLNTFDGILKHICNDALCEEQSGIVSMGYIPGGETSEWAEKLLKRMWENSSEQLRSLRAEGNLAFFVSSDVYNAYEDALDNVALEAAYMAKQNGRDGLYYRGIPVVDVQMNGYNDINTGLPTSFAILTDRRNLALAVNTNDFPGTEVRMWYNPDLMENRQRAIFMAGCNYLVPELVTIAVGAPFEDFSMTYEDGVLKIVGKLEENSWITEFLIHGTNHAGEEVLFDENLIIEDGTAFGEYDLEDWKSGVLKLYSEQGHYVEIDI